MLEIISIISIGIALSMDAFSISLGIGTVLTSKKKQLQIATTVGIFHFIMPLLGLLLGDKLILTFHIKAHILMSWILLLIAFEMIKEAFSKEETKFNFNLVGILGFALTVSIDSFSTGIGLGGLSSNTILSAFIFSISSFLFTYLGLFIGRKSQTILGKFATLFGAIILIIVAGIHFAM